MQTAESDFMRLQSEVKLLEVKGHLSPTAGD